MAEKITFAYYNKVLCSYEFTELPPYEWTETIARSIAKREGVDWRDIIVRIKKVGEDDEQRGTVV